MKSLRVTTVVAVSCFLAVTNQLVPTTTALPLGEDPLLDDFSCPAYTTCPTVCVADLNDCPKPQCDDGLFLCSDGNCVESSFLCDNDPAANPCARCSRTACPRYNDYYNDCLADNQAFYDHCDAVEIKHLFSLRAAAAFVPLSMFLLWTIALTLMILLWCRLNHHAAATQTLENEQTQTGYTTKNFIGRALYAATLITLAGFQGILLLTAVGSYYVSDQKAILVAFEIAWTIGFLWTLMLKWPFSIESIFWKQCPIAHADQICVFVPKHKENDMAKESTATPPKFFSKWGQALDNVVTAGNLFMSMIFAAPAHGLYGSFHFVPVKTDQGKGDERRFFVFQFRCYNYHVQEERFLPGKWDHSPKLAELVQERGLSMAEVQRRLRVVGPNKIESALPTALQCLIQEFSKPFYTYQTFILWTWVPLDYYFLAVVHGTVIVFGGFSVAWFRYRNESNLYQLTHVDGTIEVLRGDQHENAEVGVEALVPGDVVVVEEGKVHADMVLIDTGDHQGILLDESGLTGESAPWRRRPSRPR
jgi:hypothetical protein